MKKVYEKPSVYIETFELSQHVATDCEFNVRGQNSPETCYAIGEGYGNERVFLTSIQCEAIVEGYCYQNSTDNTPIFSSY